MLCIYTLVGDHLKSLRYLKESGDEGPRNSSVVPKIFLLNNSVPRALLFKRDILGATEVLSLQGLGVADARGQY